MTFGEYNLAIMRNPVLGKLLPLECRKTYPWFELKDSSLCASFVGFKMNPSQNGMEVCAPSYYLKITYPQCSVKAFVKLSGRSSGGHLMEPQERETIKSLTVLCDRVLKCYDEKSDSLSKTIAEYNALLEKILEREQLAVLEKMAQL